MKNKFTLAQVAQIYTAELGVDTPIVYEYLIALFDRKRGIDSQLIENYEKQMREVITTNSEYFPEYWKSEDNTNIY